MKVSAEIKEFDVKAVLFKYKEECYETEEIRVTSRDNIRRVLGTLNGKTYSIHLGKGVVVYANPEAYNEIGHMTANATDSADGLYFWGGDFLVCGETENALRDVTEEDILFAYEKISSKYLKK